MARMDTINATAIPTMRMRSSWDVKLKPNFTSFKALPPSMAGMARKNVNSAAVVREIPISRAPTIVAPEREVPGNTAAIIWNTAMIRAAV